MFVDPDDGVKKMWSEDHVSEDFQMALTLQALVSAVFPSSRLDCVLIPGLHCSMGDIQPWGFRRRRLTHLRR